MNTSEDCMRAAFQAVLRGDYAERDRWCARAKKLMQTEEQVRNIGAQANAVRRVMSIDFFVTESGSVVPTQLMLKAAKVV